MCKLCESRTSMKLFINSFTLCCEHIICIACMHLVIRDRNLWFAKKKKATIRSVLCVEDRKVINYSFPVNVFCASCTRWGRFKVWLPFRIASMNWKGEIAGWAGVLTIFAHCSKITIPMVSRGPEAPTAILVQIRTTNSHMLACIYMCCSGIGNSSKANDQSIGILQRKPLTLCPSG